MAGTPTLETSAEASNWPTREALERAHQMLQAGKPISDQALPGDLNAYHLAIEEQASRLA